MASQYFHKTSTYTHTQLPRCIVPPLCTPTSSGNLSLIKVSRLVDLRVIRSYGLNISRNSVQISFIYVFVCVCIIRTTWLLNIFKIKAQNFYAKTDILSHKNRRCALKKCKWPSICIVIWYWWLEICRIHLIDHRTTISPPDLMIINFLIKNR